MALYLAVDAGGTKADYVLADEHQVLARVRGHTIKRLRVDETTAAAHLDTALTELSEQAGLALRQVSHTCIGTAGNTVPLVQDWLRTAFAQRVGGGLLLLGDVEIALDAAFPGGPGIVVIAGTGSNVAGRGQDGTMTTAGGWGPVLSDQGSGHRIGSEALRAMFLARDEGKSTLLFPALLDFWQLSSADALIEYAHRAPPPNLSSLTGVVLKCAEQGDSIATGVLHAQGEELGYLVRLVMRRLLKVDEPSRETHLPGLAFAGSILENIAPVRTALVDSVRREFPGLQANDGVVDPIRGALWRARTGPR